MQDPNSMVPWPPDAPAAPPSAVQRYDVPPDLEVVAEGLAFPEGPIACRDGSILVVEVRGGTLTRVDPAGSATVVADLGGGPNGAAVGPDGAVYVCNNGGLPWSQLEDGSWYPIDVTTGSMTPEGYSGGWLERVDPATGDARRIIERYDGQPLSAPNDIAFDATGRMWFTDTGKSSHNATTLGAVYRAQADGTDLTRIARVLGPNGIGFSPDGGILHVSDTPTGRVLSWELEGKDHSLPPGARPVVRARLPGMIALDSLAVDVHDRVLVALPGAGALGVVQPDGGVWLVSIPDPMPTNVCFGGDDGRTLFVTLGGHGRLVRFRWPCPGAPLPYAI